jgi:hypothetical protein
LAAGLEPNIEEKDGIEGAEGIEGADEQAASAGTSMARMTLKPRGNWNTGTPTPDTPRLNLPTLRSLMAKAE